MTTSVRAFKTSAIDLTQKIADSQTGVKSQILMEDGNCRYILISLATGAKISEHASARNATVNVITGEGTLTLEGAEIALKPGVLVVMPANARHAIIATTNLTLLLTLSEQTIAAD
jgi:quercetin dioxygenase-like cupin family protein